eukprot:COSAG05_NODE_142_length_16591_cov_6.726837_4_plen_158_part_00
MKSYVLDPQPAPPKMLSIDLFSRLFRLSDRLIFRGPSAAAAVSQPSTIYQWHGRMPLFPVLGDPPPLFPARQGQADEPPTIEFPDDVGASALAWGQGPELGSSSDSGSSSSSDGEEDSPSDKKRKKHRHKKKHKREKHGKTAKKEKKHKHKRKHKHR